MTNNAEELRKLTLRTSELPTPEWAPRTNLNIDTNDVTFDLDYLGKFELTLAFSGLGSDVFTEPSVAKFIDNGNGRIFAKAHLHECRSNSDRLGRLG